MIKARQDVLRTKRVLAHAGGIANVRKGRYFVASRSVVYLPKLKRLVSLRRW